MEVKKRKIESKIKVKSITDVPNEVIQKLILIHLSSDDVCSFGMTRKRFKQIADEVIEKRSE